MSRRDVLIIALVVSIIVHIVLMFWARPKVMTSVARGLARVKRHVNTVQRENPPEGDLTEMSLMEDEEAKKEAPEINDEELLKLSALSTMNHIPLDDNAQLSAPEPAEISREIESYKILEAPNVFDTMPRIGTAGKNEEIREKIVFEAPETIVAATIPPKMEIAIEPEAIAAPDDIAPDFDAFEDAVSAAQDEPEKLVKDKTPDFKPVDSVLPEVNESIVEAEKAAVKNLIDALDAKEITDVVEFSAARQQKDGYTYFKITVTPKPDLPIVAKDIVVLIDTSPSVGRDRLASVKDAIKRLLVNGTNTGDRFNIVAFSDKFQYAFTSWQECNAASFDYADRWIDNRVLHGWTDVFGVIKSVLTLPRDPKRPLIALVVTDGDANAGVSETAQILSRFSALNDGLISVYMYGVKSSANKELIDVLTRGNRGESMIYREGFFKDRAFAGDDIDIFANRFKMPVVTDLRVVFASDSPAEAYPSLLRNLYRGNSVDIIGRVPGAPDSIAFSLKGLAGDQPYESFVRLPLDSAVVAKKLDAEFASEVGIERKTRK